MEDAEETSAVRVVLLGKGEWVSRKRELHWVQRYASVVKTYSEECVWFVCLDFASSLALAAIGSMNTSNLAACGHVKLFQAIILCTLLLAEAVAWPHSRMRDSVLDFVALGVQCVSLLLLAVGFYKGMGHGDELFVIAGYLLLFATVLLVVKVVLDVLCEMYIFYTGRRRRLQLKAWQKAAPCHIETPSERCLYDGTTGYSAYTRSSNNGSWQAD
eukprot:TRINITY_DN48507_c0_g1_i1.p1 TRINITY_DN48507_c0_g1~~TRINITY_DN48507_c0_g1_i1.p1  ORF type:complete len:215 (+),score=48.05 TRINITY_DN48507_c0_g1_i1:2-646(+)